ncbi:MBL fold metallo-hydrolase [Streptomyces spectabilis]|uniref:MBL fold metallo-hydrolase n=1 Tax=Streptomyces spectabilis TaxID=68270 RepID=UPI001CEF7B55|nr:hypothetical protein [Streptomyces spectabilis]
MLLAERELALHRLAAEVVDPWSTREVGPFSVTAVPAVDGLGDPPLNWVVQAEGQRVFRGDTMFHGYRWLIARRFSPFDAVFLPANGVVVDAPHLQEPAACRDGPEAGRRGRGDPRRPLRSDAHKRLGSGFVRQPRPLLSGNG